MKTVKQACQLAPNALSIDVSDQIEQLDQLIQDEGNGEAFYSKTFITAGMRDLLRGTIERWPASRPMRSSTSSKPWVAVRLT